MPGKSEEANRFYIDCEFDGHAGALLSFAIVGEDWRGLHIRTEEKASDPWVVENVVPLMRKHNASQSITISAVSVGSLLKGFIGSATNPVIIADSPVDIGRFCQAISTGPDGGWAPTDYPRMTFEVHNVDCYPTTLPNAVQHNAWWDAMALRHLLSAPDGSPEGLDAKRLDGEAATAGNGAQPEDVA